MTGGQNDEGEKNGNIELRYRKVKIDQRTRPSRKALNTEETEEAETELNL